MRVLCAPGGSIPYSPVSVPVGSPLAQSYTIEAPRGTVTKGLPATLIAPLPTFPAPLQKPPLGVGGTPGGAAPPPCPVARKTRSFNGVRPIPAARAFADGVNPPPGGVVPMGG